nr:hypothetical protein [Saccharothrix sp. NRRL B-16314]
MNDDVLAEMPFRSRCPQAGCGPHGVADTFVSLDPLARHADASTLQDLVHPRAAVGAAGGGVDVGDLAGDRPVVALTAGRVGLPE